MSFLLYWVLSAFFFFLLIVKNIVKQYFRASLIAKLVKNLPAVQETRFHPLVRRSLEEGVATHSSILAWRIPWTEELGGLQSTGSQQSDLWTKPSPSSPQ